MSQAIQVATTISRRRRILDGTPRGTAGRLILLLSASEREEFAALEIREFAKQVRYLVHSGLGHVVTPTLLCQHRPSARSFAAGQGPVKG